MNTDDTTLEYTVLVDAEAQRDGLWDLALDTAAAMADAGSRLYRLTREARRPLDWTEVLSAIETMREDLDAALEVARRAALAADRAVSAKVAYKAALNLGGDE